ncbi:hypothetical protein [Guptibacillus algicola]|uniref:hypothetical protein n=1 Tax=Guptibacillus algicola TaxID=225844 RepID=UPI001CD6687F|nr:hypothetical protein [Alkalihalobacillus algicola]MCA0989127.1 hypothetical protein [Alkalihalobacillus algicola]
MQSIKANFPTDYDEIILYFIFLEVIKFAFVLFSKLHINVDWSGRMLDSCGMCGTGEAPQERFLATRRLTARPAESEHPGAEIPSYKMLKVKKKLKRVPRQIKKRLLTSQKTFRSHIHLA